MKQNKFTYFNNFPLLSYKINYVLIALWICDHKQRKKQR